MFLTHRTDFNSDLARAEHLVIEDENNAIDTTSRWELAAAIKDICVNEVSDVHGKHRDKLSVCLRQRLSISCNDEPRRLLILPPLDSDVADKIILLHCSRFEYPIPLESAQQKKAFWETIDREIPGFLYYLTHKYQIPEKLRDYRYGIATFHHPELLRHLDELSPEMQLLDLIDLLRPWVLQETEWRGRSMELRSKLINDEVTKFDARKLLYYPNSCGEYLGKLARSHPHPVKRVKSGSNRHWIITRPDPEPDPESDEED